MTRRQLIACGATLALAGVIAIPTLAQAPADFSGRWAIDSSPAPAPAAQGGSAAAARPDQGTLAVGDMGSGWGTPLTITQDARQLVVEHVLFSRYDAMPPVRLVYALDGSESRNDVMTGHASQLRVSRAAWDGPALRITTRYPAVEPATGKPFAMDVIHRLTLESPTTLVVEVTRGAALGGKPSVIRTIYRKS